MAVARLLLAVLAALAAVALAADAAQATWAVEGSVKPVADDVQVWLQGDEGQWHTSVDRRGNFIFPHVASGVYVLDVFTQNYTFSSIRIEVNRKDSGKVKARLHMPDWQDGSIVPVAYPLVLEPIERTVWLDQREPFNFMSLLMSPMMLMVGFSVVMVVVMPYLTRQLELEKQREEQEAGTAAPPAHAPFIKALTTR